MKRILESYFVYHKIPFYKAIFIYLLILFSQEFTRFYVGVGSTLLLYGTDVTVSTSRLDCDSATANIEIPDSNIFVANDGDDESTISCSFQVSTDGQLRMPRIVTLTGSNNQFDGECFWRTLDITWGQFYIISLDPVPVCYICNIET